MVQHRNFYSLLQLTSAEFLYNEASNILNLQFLDDQARDCWSLVQMEFYTIDLNWDEPIPPLQIKVF